MRKMIPWIVAALGGFVVWQWWLARLPGDAVDADKVRKSADKLGQVKENAGIAAKPPLMSKEALTRWDGLFQTGASVISDMFTGGKVKPDKDPFIFGYN